MSTPCPNWRLCGEADWMSGAYCGNCYWMFNKTFEFNQTEIECSVCLETTADNIKLPCGHEFCISCFKRQIYGRDDIPQPDFPYDDEYEPSEQEWQTDPKLIDYNKKYDEWERKVESHSSSGLCSLCRETFRRTSLECREHL
tara:strand:+ start:658 stop:1083 length:426 start_codon:yes stop_codon:yes gene_type:complete